VVGATACGNDGVTTPGRSGGAAGSPVDAGLGGSSGNGGGGVSSDAPTEDGEPAIDAAGSGGASSDARTGDSALAMDASVDASADGGGLCAGGDCTGFAGAFDGFLFEYPCAAATTFDCAGAMCTGGALTITRAIQVKGDPNQIYRIDFRAKGVTESKNYTGGTRRATGPIDPGPTGGDLWYEGGTAPLSTYSSYELHVTPPVDGAPNDYFLNARDGTDEHDGSTWALDYAASIKVHGGGTITFKTFDSNCTAELNCGVRPQGTCQSRILDLSGAVPAPPATFSQPPKNATGAPVQWLFIDVTNVEAL
jgi:hypothetical protein